MLVLVPYIYLNKMLLFYPRKVSNYIYNAYSECKSYICLTEVR